MKEQNNQSWEYIGFSECLPDEVSEDFIRQYKENLEWLENFIKARMEDK